MVIFGLGLLAILANLYVNVLTAPLVRNDFDAREYLQRYDDLGSNSDYDAYVAALRSFQKLAHVPTTGEFDAATKKMMNTPRCGYKSKSARQKRYATGGKWPVNNLTWRINSFSDDLPHSDIKRIMKDSFKVWADVSPLTFAESNATDADIIIDFAEGDHGYYGSDHPSFDGPSGELAHTYVPDSFLPGVEYPFIVGNVHFDDAEDFTQYFTFDGIDLFWVTIHEFGHSIGLEHSEYTDAIMYPFYRGYVPDVHLHKDDIAGIQHLYGPPCPRKLDAIVKTADGKTYAFVGDLVYQIAVDGLGYGTPRQIRHVFDGLPNDIDAGFFYPKDKKTYFFKGNQYYRYSGTSADDGYPKGIHQWGLPRDIDAAFIWSGNSRLYFIKGNRYYRANPYLDGIDTGYPRYLSKWGLPVDRIDAAQLWGDGRTYFFSGDEYYRYNDVDLTADNGYPRPTNWWFGCGDNIR